jgi:hypothetical protein
MNDDARLIWESYTQSLTENEDIDSLIKDFGAVLAAPGESRDAGAVTFKNGYHYDWHVLLNTPYRDMKSVQGVLYNDKEEEIAKGSFVIEQEPSLSSQIKKMAVSLLHRYMKQYSKKQTELIKFKSMVSIELDEDTIIDLKFDGYDADWSFREDWSSVKDWSATVLWPEFNLKFSISGGVDYEPSERRTYDHPGSPEYISFSGDVDDVQPMSPAERKIHKVEWDEHTWAIHKNYEGVLGRMSEKERIDFLSSVIEGELESYLESNAKMEDE